MRFSKAFGVMAAAAALFFCAGPPGAQARHPLESLQVVTDAMKPGEWTLLLGSAAPFGTFNDGASAAYDFRRHNWYFSPGGGPALFYSFEAQSWGRRVAGSSPAVPAQTDSVVWHDQRSSGLWLSGTTAQEYAEAGGWKAPLSLSPASAGTSAITFYRPLSASAVVIPLAAGQGPFEVGRSGTVSRRSSTPWKTTGAGVGAYDWIRDQAYVFHNDGSSTTFYVFPTATLSADPIGTATAASIPQPAELTGAGGIGHKCGTLFVDDYDMLFVWCGGRALWTYEPRQSPTRWTKYDNAWSDAAPSSGANVAVNNRLIYISELQVFAGFTNAAEGIWLYKWLSEPEPAGTVIAGCGSVNGPCIEFGGGALGAWQALSVPASGATVVVTAADTQFQGPMLLTSGSAWRRIIGRGVMNNARCRSHPPAADCDRPKMYHAPGATGMWLSSSNSGPLTVQHMHVHHIRDTVLSSGTGLNPHRQVTQIIDSYFKYCGSRCIFTSADARIDNPDIAGNDKVIIKNTEIGNTGGSHGIYIGVTGYSEIDGLFSCCMSTGGQDAGHALKNEAQITSVTNSLLSIGYDHDGPDCSNTTDWTNWRQDTCYGNWIVYDSRACTRGVFKGNVLKQSFRSSTAPLVRSNAWVLDAGNIWVTAYDVVWGKEVGQTLTVGQKKLAKAWLTANFDYWYDDLNYKIYMYLDHDPDTEPDFVMQPLITSSGDNLGGGQQSRPTVHGCESPPAGPWEIFQPPGFSYPTDQSQYWGAVASPDTGTGYWADVAAAGIGSDEKEARNPYFAPMIVIDNTFECRNCAWSSAAVPASAQVWSTTGTYPSFIAHNIAQAPLTYARWYCLVNPTRVQGQAGAYDLDCPALSAWWLAEARPLPAGWIERARVYHGGNCLVGFDARDWWPEINVGAMTIPTDPANNQWGFGNITEYMNGDRMRQVAADACPAGTTALPKWLPDDIRDPNLFWRRGYYGVKPDKRGYFYPAAGSAAH